MHVKWRHYGELCMQLHAMLIMTKLLPGNAKLWFVDDQRLENGAISKVP
jgi:hypothetical protein